MLGGPERPLQRLRHHPRRRRRDRGVRLGRDAPADVPDVGRGQAVQGRRSSTARTATPRASRRRRSTSRASTPTATSAARPACIAWSGSARSTRPDRRQTSFASVDVLPEIDDTIDIVLRDDELKRDVFRCGGPGGQHQNKTESGVRYTHLPTGVAAESPQRAVAAQERRPGPGPPQGEADPPGGREARGRVRQGLRREGRDRLRQPDPLVRPPAVPASSRTSAPTSSSATPATSSTATSTGSSTPTSG